MTRQFRRSGLFAVALVLSGLALSACRASPDVAAYVGHDVISTEELESAVHTGLADKAVAAVYDGQQAKYREVVLQDLIATDVYDAAVDRYDVSVSSAQVDARLADLLAQSGGADAVYAAQAQQGLTRADVREQVRRFMIGEEIAQATGLDAKTSDAALRSRYDDVRGQYAQYQLGLITAPDQAGADAVLAALQADPASYPAVAQTYAGNSTLPQTQSVTAQDLGQLADRVAALQPGQGFTEALVPGGGISVIFLSDLTYPSFEDLRSTLQQQAAQEVQTALDQEIRKVRESLDITVNPRYGSFDESGSLVPDDRGVVTVVGAKTPAAQN